MSEQAFESFEHKTPDEIQAILARNALRTAFEEVMELVDAGTTPLETGIEALNDIAALIEWVNADEDGDA